MHVVSKQTKLSDPSLVLLHNGACQTDAPPAGEVACEHQRRNRIAEKQARLQRLGCLDAANELAVSGTSVEPTRPRSLCVVSGLAPRCTTRQAVQKPINYTQLCEPQLKKLFKNMSAPETSSASKTPAPAQRSPSSVTKLLLDDK